MSVFRATDEWLQNRVRQAPVVDTTGCAIPKAAGKYPKPSERDVLAAILEYLPYAKSVAWFARMNAGAYEVDNRFVRFGFKGCSDIIGQLRDGRFLAIEVKRPGGLPTPDQINFMLKVDRHNGVAFVAQSVADVQAKLCG